MEQGSLLDPEEPAIGAFQRDAHETARGAAIDLYERSGKQRGAVLKAFREAGESGLTDEEGELSTGITRFRTRRAELMTKYNQPIHKSTMRRKTTRGKPAIVWVYQEWPS